MGCLLWVQPLIDILPQLLQWFVQYYAILDHIITALNCYMIGMYVLMYICICRYVVHMYFLMYVCTYVYMHAQVHAYINAYALGFICLDYFFGIACCYFVFPWKICNKEHFELELEYHSTDSSNEFHSTQTTASEVRWGARFSGQWVATSMFA